MEDNKNLAGFINSITENLTNLVRGHIELAKAEIAEAIKNAIKSSVLFMIALAMVNLGMIFLFIGGAFWISEIFDLSNSAGFAITGGVLVAVALVFIGIGVTKIKRIGNSHKTIDSINATAESLRGLIPGKK